jgi:AraC-like DNA-binding protein
VQDDPRSGQPKTQRTDENVDRVRTLVRSDRRLGVKSTAEELNMNRKTVRQIITDDLGMRKCSTKMVPSILTDDQKRQIHISFDILYSVKMFNRVVTCDETWCFQYNLEIKRLSMQWKTQEFTLAEKSTHVSLAVQDHACVFLQSQGDSSL